MDLVCMDFLSMEADSKGISNVLVVTDHFTRYVQAYPTKSQKAQVVANIQMENGPTWTHPICHKAQGKLEASLQVSLRHEKKFV